MRYATAEHLAQLIKRHCRSRVEVAESLGVSEDAIDNWCSGRTKVALWHLDALNRILRNKGAPVEAIRQLTVLQLQDHGLSDRWVNESFADVDDPESAAHTVLFLANDLSLQISARLANFFKRVLGERGLRLHTMDISDGDQQVAKFLSRLASAPYYGVIVGELTLTQQRLSAIAGRLDQLRRPTVYLANTVPGLPSTACALEWPHEAVAEKATNILISAGHRRIGFVSSHSNRATTDRRTGYAQALVKAGLTREPAMAVEVGGFSDTGDDAELDRVTQMIASQRATGIVASGNAATSILLRAVKKQNLAWPNEISIVALGWIDWISDIVEPPLTCVTVPLGELCYLAVDLLGRLVSSRSTVGSGLTIRIPLTACEERRVHNGSVAPPRM